MESILEDSNSSRSSARLQVQRLRIEPSSKPTTSCKALAISTHDSPGSLILAPSTFSQMRQELAKLKHQLTARDSRLSYLERQHAAVVQSRLQEVRTLVTTAQTLDLAFLFDTTCSMHKHIEVVKSTIMRIAEGIADAYPDCRLRVGFAQYRDYEYKDECGSCDFTNSFQGSRSKFVTALSRVRTASGGDDQAEDVFTGLERLAALSWEASNRVVIHIADAPCHGTQFHDLGVTSRLDRYPEGDKLGRNIQTLLQNLRESSQISCYFFHHLNSTTEKMLKEFKEAAGQADWIHEEKFQVKSGALTDIPSKVVAICTETISKTLSTVAASSMKGVKTIPCRLETEVPKWVEIAHKEGQQFRYRWYDNLDDVLDKVRFGRSLELENMGSVLVRIAPHPFSKDGAARWPYYGRVTRQGVNKTWNMVLKRFKIHVGEDTRQVHAKERYLSQMEVQSVSAQLAHAFNLQIRSFEGAKQVKFTMVSMVQLGKDHNPIFYNMEKFLNGEWIRYSNNAGYVNTQAYAATLQAFSHWTHERSDGLLMVTDLQGIRIPNAGPDEAEFWLCDPAIHCTDMLRFSRTNLGEEGFKLFFKSHQCNTVCRKLNLLPSKNGYTIKGTQLSSSGC